MVPLAEAEQALIEGRFERVRERAAVAIAEGLPAQEQVRAFELLGTAEAAFGREDAALLAFRRLLWHAPDHALPANASPKLLTLMERAREAGPARPAEVLPRELPVGPPGYVQAARGADPAVEAAPRTPLYGRWWFWAVAGGVGLGAGLAAWQLARPELPRGSLGREVLQ